MRLSKKIIERLKAFVEETEDGRFVNLVPDSVSLEVVQFSLVELKLLVKYMEQLDEAS